jgi:hypothetical protein
MQYPQCSMSYRRAKVTALRAITWIISISTLGDPDSKRCWITRRTSPSRSMPSHPRRQPSSMIFSRRKASCQDPPLTTPKKHRIRRDLASRGPLLQGRLFSMRCRPSPRRGTYLQPASTIKLRSQPTDLS